MEAGFKVGLYTSPHLISFRERIRINGLPISEEDITRLIEQLIPHIEAMAKEVERPTYFEICTMMAFLYFKENNVNFMVLETGMGGKLDSTNIVRPLVSVITSISYDHVKHLGPKIEDIAFEKSGIIKNNSVVVSSPQSPAALDVIRRIAAESNSKLYLTGKDSFYEKLGSDLERQNFSLITKCGEYPHLEIRLLGDFQIENAATAVLSVEGLQHYGIFVDKNAVANGLRSARWPGRFEILRKRPFVVVDGAQNIQSASILKKAVKDNLTYKKLFLVLGVMYDKDVDGICKELSQVADYVITTKAKSDRACSSEVLRDSMRRFKDVETVATKSVGEAVNKSLSLAGKDGLVLITGSLYVVGEAIERLQMLRDVTKGA
jgi:dihydrofolate synthase/folylpolyglutamate synthase